MRFLGAGAVARVPPTSKRATTDEEGAFVLEEVPIAPERGGTLQVRLGATRIEERDACPRADGETRVLELMLQPKEGLRGRLFVNGNPEFGYVWLLDDEGTPGSSIKTDPAGRFLVTGLADGLHRLQGCTGDGTAVYSEPLEVRLPTGGPVEVHIHASYQLIEGRVTDSAGQPQAGVAILCFAQRERGRAGGGTLLESSTDTVADGRYTLRLSPNSTPDQFFTVKTTRAGAVYESVDIVGNSDGVDFVLPETSPVRLELRRLDSDEPVSSVAVAWYLPSIGARASFSSGIEMPTVDGTLQLELPIGELELEVSAPSLGLRKRTVDATVFRSTEPTTITIELR